MSVDLHWEGVASCPPKITMLFISSLLGRQDACPPSASLLVYSTDGLAHKQLKHLSLNFLLTSLNFPQLFLISPTSLHSLYAKVELYDSNLVYLCAIIKN